MRPGCPAPRRFGQRKRSRGSSSMPPRPERKFVFALAYDKGIPYLVHTPDPFFVVHGLRFCPPGFCRSISGRLSGRLSGHLSGHPCPGMACLPDNSALSSRVPRCDNNKAQAGSPWQHMAVLRHGRRLPSLMVRRPAVCPRCPQDPVPTVPFQDGQKGMMPLVLARQGAPTAQNSHPFLPVTSLSAFSPSEEPPC